MLKNPAVKIICCIALLSVLYCQGCSNNYTTPGRGVSIADIAQVNDAGIAESFLTKPAARFPARLSVVRVQESGYRSYRNHSHGHGTPPRRLLASPEELGVQ